MNHRSYVGAGKLWDLLAAEQFCRLIEYGLREHHTLLDIGCGALRAGRLLIPYLGVGKYHGLEPNVEAFETGRAKEHLRELWKGREARIAHRADFDATEFGVEFDYVLAHSILSHTGLDLAERFWEQVARVLAPEGMVLATFNRSNRDARFRGWIYPGCCGHTLSTMKTLAAKYGLFLESTERRTPTRQTWVKATRST